jgi:hypothetical protein
MRGTRIEKEVEICFTNLANKTKCMSTNTKKWKTICEDVHYLPLAPSIEKYLNTPDRNRMETLEQSDSCCPVIEVSSV